MAWREAGARDGRASVFLHGLGGRRTNWDAQLVALGDIRRCCALDLPGYGDSAGLPGSLPEIAAGVARWIAGLGNGPVDVVGLSFGGMVAQHLTLDHPDLVRTLTLLDTSPAFGLDGVTTPETWLASRIDAIRDPDPRAPGIEAVVAGTRRPRGHPRGALDHGRVHARCPARHPRGGLPRSGRTRHARATLPDHRPRPGDGGRGGHRDARRRTPRRSPPGSPVRSWSSFRAQATCSTSRNPTRSTTDCAGTGWSRG